MLENLTLAHLFIYLFRDGIALAALELIRQDLTSCPETHLVDQARLGVRAQPALSSYCWD